MDTGVDTSVTIEELPNAPDVGAQSLHTPRFQGVDPNPADAAGERHPPLDRIQPTAAVTNAVPQVDPVFVPIMDDQMDWRPSPESTQDDNQPGIPPAPWSEYGRAHWPRSNSPPPPDRQDGSIEGVRSDEAQAFWTEFEDDLSTPSDTELREIESPRYGDYSACEHHYWEQFFYRDLEDPEYRATEKARVTWKFQGVRGTRDRPNRADIMLSPAAYVGGYWWTIKFFPRGNGVSSLSIYLECSRSQPATDKALCQGEFSVVRGPANADLSDCDKDVDLKLSGADDPPACIENYYKEHSSVAEDASRESWRVPAQIGVVLYNPEEPRAGLAHTSCHQFNPHNADWGWTNFLGSWDSVHRRQRGQRRALLQRDTLAFDAYIRIFDDPTQSLWWHPSDSEPTWDSLRLTGYRPLGGSISTHSPEVAGLASWIHLAPFCRIIQGVDILEHLTDSDVKPRPLCDALQKFLWELRGCDEPLEYADTDGITSVLNNLREHSSDVPEFWERLRRTLELEIGGTDAAKQFAKLFDSPTVDELDDGPIPGPVHTLPKDFNSRICVPAEKVKSTREALERYLSARPGRWLLPPVLHIELDRQKLDMLARQWCLVYDRVELDEALDLNPWVLQGHCGNYVLYGYVVHRERRTSGKFLSILRPGGPGTKWLAFDDSRDDARVECLTHKAALQSRIGVDTSQSVDHRRGHDVAVVAMYVRSDALDDFLPGPQGRWDASETMRKYYENGTHLVLKAPDEATAKEHLQVEVYSLHKYDELGGLFDTYDLMSYAKMANSAMYLNLPRSTSMAEVRKRIALWASTDNERTRPEHVRLWHIGHSGDLFGATLAFRRISDLDTSLEQPLSTVRLWMEVVSGEDAKYFAMSDPQEANTSEGKQEDGAGQHGGSDTSAAQSDSDDPEQVGSPIRRAGHNGHAPHIPAELSPSVVGNTALAIGPSPPAAPHGPVPVGDGAVTNATANDATIATTIANDVEAMGAEEQGTRDEAADDRDVGQTAAASEAVVSRGRETRLPVRHVYYFIQVFNTESQTLQTMGSFFSRLEENIKTALRKQLHWTEDKDFSIWKRTDRPVVTAMTSGETFEEIYVPDGACFIVRDKLNKERRAELEASGKFTRPDLFIDYLWAKSRNHPIQAFNGFKTVEATFTGDYYSGDFKNGHYHGRGKHISSSACTYEGDFVFGRRHGKGVMVYPSGDSYDGDWVDDKRHGHGTFIEYKTGNKYVGGYKDGRRHGKGVSYWEVADEEMDLCQICYGEEQDALFYDCGHVCACVPCARQVDVCPICRKNVIGVVRIYRT